MSANRDGSVETDGSALDISTNRAAMIEYAPDASRLKTYNRWPATSPMVAKDLCEAGETKRAAISLLLQVLLVGYENFRCAHFLIVYTLPISAPQPAL